MLSCCDHETLNKISVISMEYHDLKRPECNALALIGILKNAGFELLSVTSDPSEFPINSGKLVMAKSDFLKSPDSQNYTHPNKEMPPYMGHIFSKDPL